VVKIDVLALRQELRITQEELARRLTVSPHTVSRWERGETAPLRVHEQRMHRMLKLHRRLGAKA
jgi:transcriptional regulator with XRE-family HTH domain